MTKSRIWTVLKKYRIVVGIILSIVTTFLVAVILTFKAVPIMFTVKAKTEIISIRSGNAIVSRWHLPNVKIYQKCIRNDRPIVFTGFLKFNKNLEIVIRRVATGPMEIKIQSIDRESDIGHLYEMNETFVQGLSSCVLITIPQLKDATEHDHTFVFPISGMISVGKEIQFTTKSIVPILHEGEVSILAEELFNDESHYQIDTISLTMGDRFYIEEPVHPNNGFILINSDPAMWVVYSAVALEGRIYKYRTDGYKVSIPFFLKLQNDKFFAGIWGLLGILIAVYKFIPGTWLIYEEKNEKDKRV